MNQALVAAGLFLIAGIACHHDQALSVTAVDARAPIDTRPSSHGAATVVGNVAAAHDAGADVGPTMSPLEQAMARLVTAMMTNDPEGVLACFSKRKPTWLISYRVDGSTRRFRFTYDVVAKGMKIDGDFWFYFFDDDSELVRGVQRNQRWPHLKDGTFVPPEYVDEKPDWVPAGVRWRREGDRYVIDAIIDSGA